MSGYIDGELLAEAQVLQADGFSSVNVGRGSKWKFINSGSSDHYAILRKGAHTELFQTLRTKDKRYRTIIEVLQRVNDDLTDNYDALLQYADNIIARLDAYYQLADEASTIRDANVTGGDEVKEIWIRDTFAWIKVEIFLDWSEDETITFAE
jgi:hypothetical protein